MSACDDARREYDSLKDSGELQVFLPTATGDWVEDKKIFILMFEENQRIIRDAMNLDTLFFKEDDF